MLICCDQYVIINYVLTSMAMNVLQPAGGDQADARYDVDDSYQCVRRRGTGPRPPNNIFYNILLVTY